MADLPGNYAIPASCASLAMPGLTCLARRFWAALTAAEPAGGMRPGLSEIPLILVIGAQKIVSDVAEADRVGADYGLESDKLGVDLGQFGAALAAGCDHGATALQCGLAH